jgi:hypothetical protein
MSLAVNSRRRAATYFFAFVTFVLGAAFPSLEIREFAGMIARGAPPARSAFLSAFFTLVGGHGLHVAAGLIWLAVMMAQVAIRGIRANVERRPCRARHRPDGGSPGVLPAHYHRAGQHQQRIGAGVWAAHRHPGRRVAMDHDKFERKHDAAG